MEHRLAQDDGVDPADTCNKEPNDKGGKSVLNRGKCIKPSAVTAMSLGTSSLGGTSNTESGMATYRNEFTGGINT